MVHTRENNFAVDKINAIKCVVLRCGVAVSDMSVSLRIPVNELLNEPENNTVKTQSFERLGKH